MVCHLHLCHYIRQGNQNLLHRFLGQPNSLQSQQEGATSWLQFVWLLATHRQDKISVPGSRQEGSLNTQKQLDLSVLRQELANMVA